MMFKICYSSLALATSWDVVADVVAVVAETAILLKTEGS
jgi:hypothetical protein